jgi:SAM-dependent methyltransferase
VKPDATRDLPRDAAKALRPGSEHYTAYVGPPGQFDFMGATQFRLLCALGLREAHRVLDLGCGSLRAGRLLIPYLAVERYHGLEPNRWLVEDAIEREIGRDLVRIKRPVFRHHASFTCGEFGVRFDYVLAQSIFSHCGPDLATRVLAEVRDCLASDGLAAATFVHAQPGEAESERSGWIYPASVAYTPDTIAGWVAAVGLVGRAIPWWHPRQTWWVLAKSTARLPDERHDALLRGAVLFDPELAGSLG